MKAVITDKLLRAIMAKRQLHPPISDQALRGLEVRFSKLGEPSFSAKARRRGGAAASRSRSGCRSASIRLCR
jgi:hypothetical protein